VLFFGGSFVLFQAKFFKFLPYLPLFIEVRFILVVGDFVAFALNAGDA
jgi:hypothetical protein